MGIEALVSAKEAGILVPDVALERARDFIYACQSKKSGAFWYKPNRTDETNAYRMGAGLLGLQLAGDLGSQSLDPEGGNSSWERALKKAGPLKRGGTGSISFIVCRPAVKPEISTSSFGILVPPKKVISQQESSGRDC